MLPRQLNIDRAASFSGCRKYRYSLTRWWRPGGDHCLWIGLNPSTADGIEDDPTIRRCVNFAYDWGFHGLVMVNLFAYRATNPKNLVGLDDLVGSDNDWELQHQVSGAAIVVAAWGANPIAIDRGRSVIKALDTQMVCLGMTQNGSPRHPLYVKKDKPLEQFYPKRAG